MLPLATFRNKAGDMINNGTQSILSNCFTRWEGLHVIVDEALKYHLHKIVPKITFTHLKFVSKFPLKWSNLTHTTKLWLLHLNTCLFNWKRRTTSPPVLFNTKLVTWSIMRHTPSDQITSQDGASPYHCGWGIEVSSSQDITDKYHQTSDVSEYVSPHKLNFASTVFKSVRFSAQQTIQVLSWQWKGMFSPGKFKKYLH